MATWTIPINSSAPLWFYCSQTALSHCQSGMVFAVNPTAQDTIDEYASAAKGTQQSSSPPPNEVAQVGTLGMLSANAASGIC